MIPKTIHYCWLSNDPMPLEIQECIKSWKEKLPDFKVKKWDTTNFDIDSVPYVREAFKEKKWAFASDYIRLYALYKEGGVYLDSDVFVIRRFDEYLTHRFFSAIECYPEVNDDLQIQAAVMGAEKEHPFIKDCMAYYQNSHFINPDNSFNEMISPLLYAKAAEKYGFKYKNQAQLLEEDMMLYSIEEIAPLTDFVSKRTRMVHCCAGSWRWNKATKAQAFIHKAKDLIVRFLVLLNLKKTWNWKRNFKNFKSSLKD